MIAVTASTLFTCSAASPSTRASVTKGLTAITIREGTPRGAGAAGSSPFLVRRR